MRMYVVIADLTLLTVYWPLLLSAFSLPLSVVHICSLIPARACICLSLFFELIAHLTIARYVAAFLPSPPCPSPVLSRNGVGGGGRQ
mmetsp:Transcript_28810/g.73760  ORF Transcript_28810/g.73760 Transcript_28810/m.73760 type:complete len:87 (+) Transcript_28810:2408-2668(+)